MTGVRAGARRVSADGYLVHALGTGPEHTAGEVLAEAAAVVGPRPVAPLVLVGSDTGALQALHAAAAADPRLPLDGVVLAGVAPTEGGAEQPAEPESDWDAELAARTACPTHRARLTEDARFVRGRLTAPVPAHLLADARPALPALILHGGADPISPLQRARGLADRLPRATLGVLHEGLHDVLNDASHRTTAATVVLWLERLRADGAMSPILTIETDATNATVEPSHVNSQEPSGPARGRGRAHRGRRVVSRPRSRWRGVGGRARAVPRA
jgi:pimeloyl-ACP methyl ester carboxylesterase